MTLAPDERKALAQDIARELYVHHEASCPLGLDADVAITLKEIANAWRRSKSAFITSVVGLLVVAVGSLILAGVIVKIRGWMQ